MLSQLSFGMCEERCHLEISAEINIIGDHLVVSPADRAIKMAEFIKLGFNIFPISCIVTFPRYVICCVRWHIRDDEEEHTHLGHNNTGGWVCRDGGGVASRAEAAVGQSNGGGGVGGVLR